MTTASQGPSFCEYFRSFYYENRNTYLPPVDLSDEMLRAQGAIVDDSEIPNVLHKKDVQDIFSVPIRVATAEGTFEKNCAVLEKHGFSLCPHVGGNGNTYAKCRHSNIYSITSSCRESWGSSGRGDCVYADNELLTIEMNKRIKQVADEAGITVSVPLDRLIPLKNHADKTDARKKYCILAGYFNYQTKEETISAIKHMTQKEQNSLAKNLCYLIQAVGIADINMGVFRLTADSVISLDPAASGLFVSKQSGASRGASVEKCARIGLTCLVKDIRKAFGTTTEKGGDFRNHIESVYATAMRPQLSKWKIALSVISLGLVPLICVIISLIQVRAIQHIVQECEQVANDLNQNNSEVTSMEKVNKYERHVAIMQSIISMTEDVPYLPK